MNYWCKICKTLLKISIAVSLIGCLMLGIACINDDKELIGCVVIFGGIMTSLVAHSFIGMIIELCENNAAMRRKICGDVGLIHHREDVEETNVTDNKAGNVAGDVEIVDGKWRCLLCGAYTSVYCSFCSGCGERRTDSK